VIANDTGVKQMDEMVSETEDKKGENINQNIPARRTAEAMAGRP
jgi:hypothetical protein